MVKVAASLGGGGGESTMVRLAERAVAPALSWGRAKFRIVMAIAVVIFYINMSNMLQLESANFYHPREHETTLLAATTRHMMEASGDEENENIPFVQQYRPIPKRKEGVQKDLVMPGDYIYYTPPGWSNWDTAPVVVEEFKLIFFTIPKVGCTVWKQLFRRIRGFGNWQSQDYEMGLPHNPQTNGLKYLYHYTLEQASEMMSSPEWTRAIMVREPKNRFLSAFLDKALGNFQKHIIAACCPDGSCAKAASQNISGFLRLCQTCHDEHWLPQSERVDSKFWPYMDVVLHVESAAEDTKKLLQRIGAWEAHGRTGWGANGTSSVFEKKVGAGMTHSTYAQWEVWKWYTPENEEDVERFYQGDYENPLFQFEQDVCLTCAA